MDTKQHIGLTRRGFCLCCIAGASFAATGAWLTPTEAFAKAGIVEMILREAATAPIKTIVIPGHGPLGNKKQLIAYRDMLKAVRDNVARLKKKGHSLDEIVAAKPSAKFDAKWGKFVIDPRFFTQLVHEGV
jgi:glyoxylase-like metal-dependent hydrolase (beta-lactamase superfamily II)